MKDLKLPKRKSIVRDYWGLANSEMLFLDLTLLTSFTRDEAYSFAFPKDTSTIASRKSKARELYNMPTSKEYLEAREKQLRNYYFVSDVEKVENGVSEEVKPLPDNWQEQLKSKAWDLVEQGKLDEKAVELLFKQAMKDVETGEVVEAPRRYLPVACSGCDYRSEERIIEILGKWFLENYKYQEE